MGLCTSCFKPTANNIITPDAETRRRQLVEAAEQRRKAEASRGIKDTAKVGRLEQKAQELQKRESELEKQGGAGLRWTAN